MFWRSGWPASCRVLILLAALLLAAGTWAQADELIIHFIDVGQGDSILIQTPAGANILVDAGEAWLGLRWWCLTWRSWGLRHWTW
jgi:beta-lactamase superfamily II metal-dependent hydrolase